MRPNALSPRRVIQKRKRGTIKTNHADWKALNEDSTKSRAGKNGFGGLSSLQQKMRDKLDSANFRMLNEAMYTSTGAEAKKLLNENQELFSAYHVGFRRQVQKWPRNPLDDVIAYLSTQRHSLRVADLGCGEARLALEVPQTFVKSFDLVASNERVQPCDIANLPLENDSIDVVVFCLSLMGTNYGDYLKEARRVLFPDGLMLITEVASRFDKHDPHTFIKGVEALGFRLEKNHPFMKAPSMGKNKKKRRKKPPRKQTSEVGERHKFSDFFFNFSFKLQGNDSDQLDRPSDTRSLPTLAACLYKKR